ncbi:MAG: GNVR domain-containing protein [Candidatus Omnitrophota bacterium]
MGQYELNLRDYIRIFRKRRPIIFLTFIIITLISALFSVKQVSTYVAVTTVKIEEHKTVAGLLTEWIVYQPGDIMESETKIVKGYPVMKKAAMHLGLIDQESTEDQTNLVVSTLQDKIEAERIANTNIIRIVATAENSQEAIEIATAVAQEYKAYNLEERRSQASSARKFIEEQLLSLEKRLREKEEVLKKFAEQYGGAALNEPFQKKLAELEFELNKLKQKYTEKHPNVIQVQEQIAALKENSKQFAGEDLKIARIARDVESDKKLFSMLKEKLEEARINESQKVSAVSIVDPAVTAEKKIIGPNKIVGLLVGGFLGLILGFALALVLENLDTSIGTIEDVERIADVPVLGVIPSVLLEGSERKKRGVFRNFKNKLMNRETEEVDEKSIRMILHYNPTSPIAEAFRNVHTNLKLTREKKTILVTSAGPREGKSTTVTNLALAVAQAGMKVLIVSTDIRRPVIGKTFGIDKEPGLTDVLLGMISLDDAVKNVTDFMLGDMSFEDIQQTPGLDNLWVLTSGKLQFNPAKLLESKEFTDSVEAMKERFDVIFFDSPPVLPVTDSSLIAKKMDCVIMVYEIGRTSREALLRAKNQLDSVGANIAGIVLNQTRQEIEADVIQPYYYKYKYYKSTEEEAAEKKGVILN